MTATGKTETQQEKEKTPPATTKTKIEVANTGRTAEDGEEEQQE